MESMCLSFFRSRRNASFLFLIVLLFSSCISSGPSETSRPVRKADWAPALSPLNSWLYRGSQPTESDFAKLKEKGIRTVINFRDEPKWIAWEKAKVEGFGMKYASLPWNITASARPELLDQFFRILDDPANRPVFFHCKYGRDRSGVMATLALMRYEKLSEEEARGIALETIRPNFRYRMFVNQKIKFFTNTLREKEGKTS